ncbi:hypothetical protein HDE_07427 [Halotydeus destructor]|nr:hypothetical protein HDE_07427 [Halotydeus destructor]
MRFEVFVELVILASVSASTLGSSLILHFDYMPLEMREEVIKITEAALVTHTSYKDRSGYINQKLDSIYGRTWGCFLVDIVETPEVDFSAAYNADQVIRFTMYDVYVIIHKEKSE